MSTVVVVPRTERSPPTMTLLEKVLLPAIVEASARVKLAAPDEKV